MTEVSFSREELGTELADKLFGFMFGAMFITIFSRTGAFVSCNGEYSSNDLRQMADILDGIKEKKLDVD